MLSDLAMSTSDVGVRTAVLALAFGGVLGACAQSSSTPRAVDSGVPAGWTVIAAGTANLNAVSGVSDSAVWVVGDRGTIARWDGAALTFETSGTTVNLRGVWALDDDHAYAVGDGGIFLERKSGAWAQVATGLTREVLTGVWADADRVVAVGSHGTVVLGTSTGYALVPNSRAENLLAVSGTSGGTVTAVGALGLVLNLDGTSLTRFPIPAFSKLLSGVSRDASGNTYFVGQEGSVYYSDSTGVNAVTGCPQASLRSVTRAADSAWIVGWDGSICQVSAPGAVTYRYSDARWFNGVYAASPTSLWVVGATGTLLHGLPSQAADGGAEGGP
jgi:photosystem II stability/assembly factor-like uncharacterized protein